MIKTVISLTCIASCFIITGNVGAWNLTIGNSIGDGAHGLFDSGGSLVSGSVTDNIRVGSFNGFDAQSAWNLGDLSALDSNFETFASSFGMNDFAQGIDGIFQDALNVTASSTLEEDQVVIWITSGGDFTDTNTEHLIYIFDTTFPVEPGGVTSLTLGVDEGVFIAGESGTYTSDYGFGSGALDGFNTVSVVPEPSAYAAISGLLALTWVMLRRRG